MTPEPLTSSSLAASAAHYLSFLERWRAGLPAAELREITASSGGPERVAFVVVDLTVGFCHSGALASPRVAALLPRVAELLSAAYAAGVRAFALPQDTHEPDAQEFASFPPHCVRGTDEARTAPELASLPCASAFDVLPKNSLSTTLGTDFADWDAARGPFATYVVVGDCTDLCIYQAAMGLQLRSNAAGLGTRVIVPADCVDTFDIPVDVAGQIGAQPHPGDFYHHVFLHAMATNGIDVVASVQ